LIRVPGRVNLIGEHIDYLGFPVLPMAIARHVMLDATPREDSTIRIESPGYGVRTFAWSEEPEPWPAGDFGNYAKAAARMVAARWGVGPGFDGVLSSTLPAAAGLSSSSALLIAVTLALLEARGIEPRFSELMEVLPDGEMYVGTRGGGMDHAVCLAGRQGCAVRITFAPAGVDPEPIPSNWAFFVAHSLKRAEKSGAVREEYNLRRRLATEGDPQALRHALSERDRVDAAIDAMRLGDIQEFGEILSASHESLRDRLQVSCEGADRAVDACLAAGGWGARIMGAGFGGYVLGVCERVEAEEVLARLERDYYRALPERFEFPEYLMRVEAGEGALRNVDS
jgi:galactokinase